MKRQQKPIVTGNNNGQHNPLGALRKRSKRRTRVYIRR